MFIDKMRNSYGFGRKDVVEEVSEAAKEVAIVETPNGNCPNCGLSVGKIFPVLDNSVSCLICGKISNEDQRTRHGGNPKLVK